MKDSIRVKDRGKLFAELVHGAIRSSEKHEIRKIAEGTGMSYHAFHQRLHGVTAFSADEIRRLIACFPAPDIVNYLLDGTAFVPAERIEAVDRSEEEEALFAAAHRVVYEAADVLEEIEKALRDHRIDHNDAHSITKEIEQAELSLITLRNYLKSKGK